MPLRRRQTEQVGGDGAQRVVLPSGFDQRCLRLGHLQDGRSDRVTLLVVAVEQRVGRAAVEDGGQFPAQVHGVLDAEVQPLPADRRVGVRRVAGEEDPPAAIVGDMAEPVGEP